MGTADDEDSRLQSSDLGAIGDVEAEPELPSGTLARLATSLSVEAMRPGGDARVSAGEILRLSWPVMLSIGLSQLGAIVDRTMIGHLGGDAKLALAAVGYVHQLFHLLQSALMGVGLACVALMARSIGANDPGQARSAFAASLEIAVAVTGVIALGILFAGEAILSGLGAEAAVVDLALPYLRYVIGSTLLLAVCMVIESALRADKNMRTPMWIAFGVTAVKLIFNWLLIYGYAGFPRLGLTGAGVATAIGQAFGLVLFLGVVVRARTGSPVALRPSDWAGVRGLRRDVIRIALPGVGERLVLNLGLLSYFWILSREYGTVAVAVYALGVPLLSFTWIPSTGYAQACASLIGQSLGAGQRETARRTGWTGVFLALATALLLGGPVIFLHESIARIFTADPDVRAGLGPFFLVLALAQPFLQVHFTLSGAHRGAGDTWTPLFASLVSSLLVRVPLALFLALVLHAPLVWVWGAMLVDHFARAAYLMFAFVRGRWLDSGANLAATPQAAR